MICLLQKILIAIQMNLEQNDYDEYFKTIIVGDSGTGKTNAIITYNTGGRPDRTTPTVGIDFYSKVVNIDNTHRIRMQIWDTAGQQQFRSVTMSHYKNAQGAFVFFDLTNRNSFNNVTRWINDVRQRSSQGVVIGIIGSKADLSDRRAVSRDQAESLASKEQAYYAETNMNNVDSIRVAFERMAHQFYRVGKNRKLEFSRTNVQLGNPNKNNSSNCQC